MSVYLHTLSMQTIWMLIDLFVTNVAAQFCPVQQTLTTILIGKRVNCVVHLYIHDISSITDSREYSCIVCMCGHPPLEDFI